MRRIDYGLPVFEGSDKVKMNEYTEELAYALKGQIDRFGNPLTFRGVVSTINDLPEEAVAGDIYNVTEINKNYVYSGAEWLEYSDAMGNAATQEYVNERGVAVDSTQPTTTEKVWIKKGKNLFNKNNVINGYRFGSDGSLYAASDFSVTDFIEVNSSTQYTVSWVIQTVQCVCYYDVNKNFISRNSFEKPFTTPANCKYIRASVLTADINSAQIEQGSQTTYEPYVEKEILVKNDNGVFEKFYNEEEINQENYSLGEQRIGTWIDGKPLYRKTIKIENTALANGNNTIAHNINNLKQCIKAELAKEGSQIFPYFNYSNNTLTITTISNVDGSGFIIRCVNDQWGNTNIWYATLYYTKTTD